MDFFSPAPFADDDDRAKKLVEKIVPMSRRPAADQLVLESDPEDWFGEAPEAQKRHVLELPATAAGTRKRRAINKRYASKAQLVLHQGKETPEPLMPTESIRDTLVADADRESDHAYGREGDEESEGEVAEVEEPSKKKKKKKVSVTSATPVTPLPAQQTSGLAPIKPSFYFRRR